MTHNTFLIDTRELCRLDDEGFAAHGGVELHIGALEEDGHLVRLHVAGTVESIRYLACSIAHHHGAAA